MPAEIPFACDCGTVHGHLALPNSHAGARVICHCRDCRAGEIAQGRPDPGAEGVELYQTTPERVVFDSGKDRLGLIRLSPKGLFRWHATCCGAPLFNTMPSPGFVFASLRTNRTPDPDALGPVVAHVNRPGGNTGLARVMAGILWRTLKARIGGAAKRDPFFDDAGQPVSAPRVLTLEERRAATPAA